jgi:hypothetical protein
MEINAGLADTKMKGRFADLGGYVPFASSAAEFRKFIADDVEKWVKVKARFLNRQHVDTAAPFIPIKITGATHGIIVRGGAWGRFAPRETRKCRPFGGKIFEMPHIVINARGIRPFTPRW